MPATGLLKATSPQGLFASRSFSHETRSGCGFLIIRSKTPECLIQKPGMSECNQSRSSRCRPSKRLSFSGTTSCTHFSYVVDSNSTFRRPCTTLFTSGTTPCPKFSSVVTLDSAFRRPYTTLFTSGTTPCPKFSSVVTLDSTFRRPRHALFVSGTPSCPQLYICLQESSLNSHKKSSVSNIYLMTRHVTRFVICICFTHT